MAKQIPEWWRDAPYYVRDVFDPVQNKYVEKWYHERDGQPYDSIEDAYRARHADEIQKGKMPSDPYKIGDQGCLPIILILIVIMLLFGKGGC